jgi:hypothetical protein
MSFSVMADMVFLESMELWHSKKEVILIILTHHGQISYCKTEVKSLYNKNSFVISFNVVVIDCIVVQVIVVE